MIRLRTITDVVEDGMPGLGIGVGLGVLLWGAGACRDGLGTRVVPEVAAT